jgi:hypothetical protein
MKLVQLNACQRAERASQSAAGAANGVWHVTDRNGMVVAGPFKTNTEALRWVAWEEFRRSFPRELRPPREMCAEWVEIDVPRPHEKATVAKCKRCGREFWRKPRGRPRKWCSPWCRDQARDRRWLKNIIGGWRSTHIRQQREQRVSMLLAAADEIALLYPGAAKADAVADAVRRGDMVSMRKALYRIEERADGWSSYAYTLERSDIFERVPLPTSPTDLADVFLLLSSLLDWEAEIALEHRRLRDKAALWEW